MDIGVSFRGLAEVWSLPPDRWRELEQLSQGGDPDSQAALDRLVQRHGHLQSRVRSQNLTTTAGMNYAIPALLPNGSWFIGAKGAGAAAVGNTMSSHAGWSELTTYTQTARPALTLGTPSGGVASNSSNVALFTAPTGGMTFNGWFVCNSSTKGGATGTLISVADHSSPQALAAGIALRQTLTVTVT
jgi:hypothetical protein